MEKKLSIFWLACFALSILTGCGQGSPLNLSSTASATYPRVSTSCGSQACVK